MMRPPEVSQRGEMRIKRSRADSVAAGVSYCYPTRARKKRPGHKHRSPQTPYQPLVEPLGRDVARLNFNAMGAGPLDCRAQTLKHLQEPPDVFYLRHVLHDAALARKESRRDDGERGVL